MNLFHLARLISMAVLRRQHAAMVVVAILLAATASAPAQLINGPGIPSAGFQPGLELLADGQYREALGIFNTELQLAHRVGQTRFIDSICYYAMIGECNYRLGNLPAALDNFAAALQIYRQYPDWMIRVKFSEFPQVQALSNPVVVPWGRSNRGSHPGNFSQKLNLQVGSLADVNNTVQRGGALVMPRIMAVDVPEVVRCVCLAMKRRRDILGPLVMHDPFTDELMGTTARRLGPPNHWSEVWIDMLQGMAYSVGGQPQRAEPMLQRSLMAMGQFDHPLTGMALAELGQIALRSSDFKTAAGYFEEATYAAAPYRDAIVMEEAFRQLHLAYLLAGDATTITRALAMAVPWAKAQQWQELYASLMLLNAETMVVAGQTQQAAGLLSDVQRTIGRRDMFLSEIGGRLNYLSAIVSYQHFAIPAGDEALKAALIWMRNGGSKWLFQIDYADKLCVTNPGGRFRSKTAMDLYEQLLRDPTPHDWAVQPRESLAVLTTPHPLPFEHWLETATGGIGQSNSAEMALDVADLARRHRFFSTMRFGGRTLALRWVLEAPDDSLPNSARLQRQELLVRYPKYAEAAEKVKSLRAKVTARGLSADADNATHLEMSKLLAELKAAGDVQEALLREIALRREAADMMFPPVRKMKDLQKSLPAGQALLAFFTTSRATYAWLYSSDKYEHWKVENPTQLKQRVVALLRAIGNFDGTRELQEQQLKDDSWKGAAKDLLEAIFGTKIKLNDQLQELVVVPDDVLWYVPFELLPAGEENQPLIVHSRVRYAPTVGLSQPERQGRRPNAEYGVAVGKLHPGDTEELQSTALADMQRVTTGAVALRGGWTTPSPLLGTALDGLIVFEDTPPSKDSFEWIPLPLDRTKKVGGLAEWLSLPWKRIDQYILPGFHSAAENSLKSGPAIPGSELFLASTGLMATGARTVLISRWRIGGQSTIDLIREFVQELPSISASEAWQRAVQLLCETPLDPQREPRVHRASKPNLKCDAPFFWASYLLVDTGVTPQKVENPVVQAADNKLPDAGKK
ncbi:MAG: CHAT domain-containing protein [Pirellulales bacterium]|nr:CHAT domain-containing protein [Pirellulales bacterium]